MARECVCGGFGERKTLHFNSWVRRKQKISFAGVQTQYSPGLLPISWSEHIQIHFVGNHMNFRFSYYFGGHLVALHDGRVHTAGEHAARTSDHPLDKWPFAVLGYRPENVAPVVGDH